MVICKLCFLLTIVISINISLCKHEKLLKKYVTQPEKTSNYDETNTSQTLSRHSTPAKSYRTRKLCINTDKTLRAKRKSCFLRPDTGPCRADIIQYYFDVQKARCFRFFWGGCQGNGNRFSSDDECYQSCFLNASIPKSEVPFFCSLAFDYGTCFGYYYRWGWDKYAKTCKRRMYSGCGGNQNNFETSKECFDTCLRPPIDTLHKFNQYTTCIPYVFQGII